MNYTLKEKNGIQTLQQNGQEKNCPFQIILPMQNKLGGIDLLKSNCSSQCTHFDIQNDGKRVQLSCGTGPAFIITTEAEKPEEKSTLKLHKA